MTTKAGTNEFHGGIYEFLQNSAFNAADPVTHLKETVRGNDFGGYVGGPLTVPHLYNSKGKTFFFADYEGTRRPEQGSIAISVPSDAFRAGNLSSLGRQLYNPATGAPFPNNQLPVNPATAVLINALYPHANQSAGVNASGVDNYVANFPGDYTLNNIDVRVDEDLTARHKIWARFGGKNVALSGTDGTTTYDPQNGTYSNKKQAAQRCR